MKFLVIGNGLIGEERIKALLQLKQEGFLIDNIYVYDVERYKKLPDGVEYVGNDTFSSVAPDWVFIATPHYMIKDWVKVAVSWGSRILIEKPMGMDYEEALEIYNSLQYPEQLYVGFNYRFFPGMKALARDFLSKKFGDIISINMSIGHGGKPDDRVSWKLDPFLGSPDPLLDPAIHFIDLLNFLTSPKRITPYYGRSWKGFWNTGISEEMHVLLGLDGYTINLQASLVRWRSILRIEINGTDGYCVLDGKGRSYGRQMYVTGKRWGWMSGEKQAFTEKLEVQDDCTDSFYLETKSLLEGARMNCSSFEALENMQLYNECLKVTR